MGNGDGVILLESKGDALCLTTIIDLKLSE